MCSCIDSGNCDFTHQCIPEGACVKENIAIGKVANISSQNINSGPACLAVNGNTTMAISSTNCVKSSGLDNYPSWTVDLGRDYTITNLSIYPERSYVSGLRGVEITVDGRLCYTFPTGPYYDVRQDVQCTQPQRGRIVKLYSTGNYYIFFCELQVWVCKAGLYGDDCDQVCHCKDNSTCDNHFGTCTAGCAGGFYGSSCKHKCGNCTNGNICNITTGVCPGGCNPGWTPPYCNETCDFGTYGQNCSSVCGHCANGEPCDNVNGKCISCEPGMKPQLCQQTCDNFKYGLNCSNNCGKCTNGEPCDKVNGMCLSCEPGWQIPLCQQVAVTSENSGNTVGAIVGAILGGFAIFGIIIAVPLILYLRRSKSRSSESRTTTNTELQPTSDKSASIKSPTSVESENVESANEYDEIENHYNSLHPIDQSEQHNYILPAFEERNVRPVKDKPVYVNTSTSDIS